MVLGSFERFGSQNRSAGGSGEGCSGFSIDGLPRQRRDLRRLLLIFFVAFINFVHSSFFG